MTAPAPQGAAAPAPLPPQPAAQPQPRSNPAGLGESAAPAAPAAWRPAGDPTATAAAGRTPSTMPRDLRRLRAAAPIACVLTGVAASGFLGTTGLQASPAATTRQLSHVTAAKQAFQRADIAAAEIVAARQLGSTGIDRTSYDGAIRSVNSSLVAAVDAAPGAASLADAAGDLTAYTTAVEQAFAGPVTARADYLKAADTARTNVLGRLDAVAAADLERLSDGGGASSRPGGTLLMLLVGGGSTVGLGLASWWLARKTHRIVNPGLAAATLVTAGLTFLTLVPSARPGTDAGAAVKAATSVATLRDNAYAARAAEVSSVLPGVDAAVANSTWQDRSARVTQALGRSVPNTWTDYTNAHVQLLAATSATRAEKLAVGGNAFGEFISGIDQRVADAQHTLDQSVAQPATVTAGVALGAGLIAGLFAWAGIGRRLQEYR